MRELKPCPFCGENPKVKQAGFGDGKQEYTIFHCKCGERYMHMSYWNTRPIEDALRAENERLRSLLRTVCNNGLELGYCEESFCLDCSNSEFSKKGR